MKRRSQVKYVCIIFGSTMAIMNSSETVSNGTRRLRRWQTVRHCVKPLITTRSILWRPTMPASPFRKGGKLPESRFRRSADPAFAHCYAGIGDGRPFHLRKVVEKMAHMPSELSAWIAVAISVQVIMPTLSWSIRKKPGQWQKKIYCINAAGLLSKAIHSIMPSGKHSSTGNWPMTMDG